MVINPVARDAEAPGLLSDMFINLCQPVPEHHQFFFFHGLYFFTKLVVSDAVLKALGKLRRG